MVICITLEKGAGCHPADQWESNIILGHLKEQPCEYQETGLDGGYDTRAVLRGLELLGSNGYVAIREYQNNAIKKEGGEVMKRKTNVLYVCGRVFRVSETDL